MDIQKSVSSSNSENKAIIQDKEQCNDTQTKTSFFKMVKDGFQGNGTERK